MLLRCESLEPRMSQRGHSLQVRPRPLVHKCPLCINTDRKFWALGFVAMCQELSHSNSDDLTTCALCACDHTGLRSNSCRSAA